jgi:hypothetical protein
MIDRFLVIVPTRGRPDNVRRLVAGLAETRTSAADFVFVVDDDDPEAMAYMRLADELLGIPNGNRHRMAVVHRMRLGGTLNFIARLEADGYPAIGFMGDDHLPKTPEWDRYIATALEADGPRVVYGNDLLQGAALPTAVFMSTPVIQALGYMVPPGMVHLYLDNFWLELGRQTGGLVYLSEVIIEHLHPAAGKADMDDRYREVNATAVDHADRAHWLQYQSDPGPDGFGFAVEKVKEAYR